MLSSGPPLVRALIASLLVGACSVAAAALPGFAQVRSHWVSSDARLLDRRGEPLAELRIDPHGRRLEWMPLEALSPALQQALIASEDKRFYQHDGVDWRAMASAAWDNLFLTLEGRRPRGASTLTMQLAGLLDPHLHMHRGGRTLAQKWDQAREARNMERTWSKAQILEAYLNLAPFHGELEGVGAAARGLFGTDAGALDVREAAVLVALLRGPNASPRVVARRACGVAQHLRPAPTCASVTALTEQALAAHHRMEPRWNLAPYLARRLLKQPGEALRTTLDAGVQRKAVELLDTQLAALAGGNVDDGAVVVLDNASGNVLAWVGGGSTSPDPSQVDGVLAPRRAGATLQPFLYELALEKHWLTAASVLDDSPLGLTMPAGLSPRDDGQAGFRGPVSVRAALAAALDLPAVRILALTGAAPFQARLRALGFDTLAQPDDGGYALALGDADVTLLSLANAYRALANGGEWRPSHVLPGEPAGPRRRVMDRGASFIVGDILADPQARPSPEDGGDLLAAAGWSAARSGTGAQMRNAWCVGFTDRYTVAVWLGNLSAAPMRNVTGISGAAPVWRALVQWLHRDLPSRPPAAPPGVLREQVAFDPPTEPERDEWYLAGTQQNRIQAVARDATVTPRIAYPAHGTLIVLDPDTPAERQQVPIAVKPPQPELRLQLDGDILPLRDGRALWSPTTGHHRLALLDADGKQIEALEFDVRAAAPARMTSR